VAYFAREGGKYVIVVDGLECGDYATVVPGANVVFDSPTKCHLVVRKDEDLYLAETEIARK
jgi:hypothetical protein